MSSKKQNEQKKWQLKMEDQRSLKRKGIKLLYQRIQLLCAIYDDDDFSAYCFDINKEPLDVLDAELDDVQVDFLTLRSVLLAFPEETFWEKGNFREMVASVLEAQKKDKQKDSKERMSWKQRALKAEAEVCRLKREIEQLRDQMTEQKKLLELFASGGGRKTA